MEEKSLSRIPFLVKDEVMILSLARWMRFIAAVKVVGGLLTAFVVLVGMIFVGAEAGPGLSALGKAGRLIGENLVTFFFLAAFGLILSVAGVWLGFVLYHAADDFDRVARTDVADQDYIAAGVARLNTYFKVSILLGVAAVLVAITAAMGLAARLSTGP